MEHFRTILRAHSYAPSTIDMYCRRLHRSGVNLQNRKAVRRYLTKGGDAQGNDYRAFLLYDRFLQNADLPGGHPTYHRSDLTIREACLAQTAREDLLRVWWLHNVRGYTPGVAVAYVREAKKDPENDRHRSVYRARCALDKFNIEHVFITDKLVRDYYHTL